MKSYLEKARYGLAAAREAALANLPGSVPQHAPSDANTESGLLRRVEDLELALNTAQTVNRHLNGEVEKLMGELSQLRTEKEAYEQNVAMLVALLRKERRKAAMLMRQSAELSTASSPLTPVPAVEEAAAATAAVATPPAPTHPTAMEAAVTPGAAGAISTEEQEHVCSSGSEHAATAAAWHDRAALVQLEQPDASGQDMCSASGGDAWSGQLPGAPADDCGLLLAEALQAQSTHDGVTGDEEWLKGERWDALRRTGEAAGWLVDPAEVGMGPKIGEGAFGITYKCTWRGATVAVKVVRVDSPSTAETFLREVEVMAAIRHPNLLPFYGACLLPQRRCCWLVTEYMPGGNLAMWLFGGPNRVGTVLMPSRSLVERLRAALDIARGMEALEGCHPHPVVHRDLKPSNIFMDGHGTARVADFGLARRLAPGYAADLTGETGTYLYMAPEVMRHEVYDSKADAYSWGITLMELINQRPPYDGLYLTPVQIALGVADGKLDPTEMLSPTVNATVAALAAMCVDPHPEMRPAFSMIVAELEVAIEEVAREQAAAAGNGVLGRMFRR